MDLESIATFLAFEERPWLSMSLGLLTLVALAWLANWITRHVLIRGMRKFSSRLSGSVAVAFRQHKVIDRLAHVIPALIIYSGVSLVPSLPTSAVTVIRMLAHAFVILTLVLTVAATLDVLNDVYQRRPEARSKPIKGYLQLVKILLFVVAALLILGAFLERDVLTLLAGLGAMAAVLLLIFQSTILSLVASVQVSSYDMVRIGDWIEMPALNADGDVIDISLHTITVQNWDKTITTIPTSRLITDTFKNWRGMVEAGGRRVKRALLIDQTSVRFLTDEERQGMHRFFLIDQYLAEKEQELKQWNEKLGERSREPVNQRRLTNLGTFRAYVTQYLRNHLKINQHLTIMVRQLDPTPTGLPLEIYCFTADTSWDAYEAVQADIFDHLLALLPEFSLRVFQTPSGSDMRALDRRLVVATSGAHEEQQRSSAALG
jgi:miniconductance mechanosensitive channel